MGTIWWRKGESFGRLAWSKSTNVKAKSGRPEGGCSQIVCALKSCVLVATLLTLPACGGFPASYPKQAGAYFKEPLQRQLAEAASHGDTAAMQQALDAGADPNAVGKKTMTPLFWVVTMDDNIDGFRYLLDHGGNPNLEVFGENRFVNVLHQAYRNPDPAFIIAALEAGADPDMTTSKGLPILFEPMTDERIEQIKALIEYGADVHYRTPLGNTPMLEAVAGNHFKTALALLEGGANPELKAESGNSPLNMIVSFREHEKAARPAPSPYADFIQALKDRGYLDASF